ncbi:hypothetical protein QCA50_005354 [Cerrena zonata]|uniref:Uncharacterized protein n=1 Tax=Cerrena zonata TaxID=2478898 RepID=A0AAW0GJJ6_9APHY
MLIIEVLRSFNDWCILLGSHKWSEFLRNPTDEEKQLETKVFYCTLSNGREVQKHGWNRIDVKESWFARWDSKNDPRIVYPYPITIYCDTPPESDKTFKPLCRPLPVEDFPRGLPPVLPPVGTTQWQVTRTLPGHNDSGKPSEGRRATQNRNSRFVGLNPPGPVQITIAPSIPNAWSRGPPGLKPPLPSFSATPPLSTPSTGSVSDFPFKTPGLPYGSSGAKYSNTLYNGSSQSLHRQFSHSDVGDTEDDDEKRVPVGQTQEIQEQEHFGSDTRLAGHSGKPENSSDTVVCPFHGPGNRQCKKGICQAWKEAVAEKKREERKRDKGSRASSSDSNTRGNFNSKSFANRNSGPRTSLKTKRSPPPWSKPPQFKPANTSSAASSDYEQPGPSSRSMPPPTNRPPRGRKMNAPGARPTSFSSSPWGTSPSHSGRSTKTSSVASDNDRDREIRNQLIAAMALSGIDKGGWDNKSVNDDQGKSSEKERKPEPSVSGDIQFGEDASTWANKRLTSWADQVETELASEDNDHKEDS